MPIAVVTRPERGVYIGPAAPDLGSSQSITGVRRLRTGSRRDVCTGNGLAEDLHPAAGPSCLDPDTADARADGPPAAVSGVSERERDGAPDPMAEPGRQSAAGGTPDEVARREVLGIAAERDRFAAELHHAVTRRLF